MTTAAIVPRQADNRIVGYWEGRNREGIMKLQVLSAGSGEYYGREITDRSQNKAGRVILKSIRAEQNNMNFKAVLLPPDAQGEIKVTLYIVDNDHLKIEAGLLLFHKTIHLTRIK